MGSTSKTLGHEAAVRLHDALGNPIETTNGSIDVNITGGVSGHVIVDNAQLAVELDAADGDNVCIKDSSGANALSISSGGAAKVDGSAVTQPISGTVAVSSLPVNFLSRSDTYTGTGNGVTVNCSTNPMNSFSIQVASSGGVAGAWDIRLEGSLDGSTFSQMVQHTDADGNGTTKWTSPLPAFYFRSRCAGLTLAPASSITATILGQQS